jgi:hypothetical protein
MPGFSDNFRELQVKKIIPSDIQESDIPPNSAVWHTIDGLSAAKIDLLQQISSTAQSHLFLIDRTGKKGKIVAMGL